MPSETPPSRNRAKSVDSKSGVQAPGMNGTPVAVGKKTDGTPSATKPQDEESQKKDGSATGSTGGASAPTTDNNSSHPSKDKEKENPTEGGSGAEESKGEKDPTGGAPKNETPAAASRIRLVELTLGGETPTEKVLTRPPTLESSISLATVRRRLAPWISRAHKFCYSDGSGEDEATSLGDYLTLARSLKHDEAADKAATPTRPDSIYVYKPDQASKLPTNIPILDKPDLGQRLDLPGATADSFKSVDKSFTDIDKIVAGMHATAKHASQLTADEWDVVLQNCSAMYGWYVNRESNKIEQAPKPAFQLRRDRSKLKATMDAASTAATNSIAGANPIVEVASSPMASVADGTRTSLISTVGNATNAVDSLSNAAASSTTSVTDTVPPSDRGTEQGLALLDTLRIVQDSSTGRELRERLEDVASTIPLPPPAPLPQLQPPKAPGPTSTQATPAAPPQLPQQPSTQATFELPGSLTNDALPLIKPRYHVNDNSRVDVFTITDEFQSSMAKNDFSAQSTEASVSGGYGGFGGSVSGGYASSKANSEKKTNTSLEKTMIAKYMYPRATITLEPSDLEPSPDLWEALVNLKQTKSVLDMRKIHRDFGHLFCRQITIGGRLLSTKILKSTSETEEKTAKEEFKASVAVAVTTPWVSGSVKHERSGGSSTEEKSGSQKSEERHAFEAVGGDTILSNNPILWASTCSQHNNWRVIERVALSPIADAISELPRMAGVKTLFAQALPTLARAIELPEGRDVQIRLRLVPLSQGSLSLPSSAGSSASHYLGHELDAYVTPKSMSISFSNTFWGPLMERTSSPMFMPKSYRAPAIYGYATRSPESTLSSTNPRDLVSTVWNLSAPFDNVVTNQCRVVLRMTPSDNDGKMLPKPLSLAVFCNQQGVFLPAMSDDDNPQIFRIVKDGASAGETIQEDDIIRLSWDVKDQNVGYRDFTEDAFGRRRTRTTQAMPLYFKLPWPRFETLGWSPSTGSPLPNNLVMSSISDTTAVKSTIRTLPDIIAQRTNGESAYMLQDVQFRINMMSDSGRAEADNYMFRPPKPKAEEPKVVKEEYHYYYLNGFRLLAKIIRS